MRFGHYRFTSSQPSKLIDGNALVVPRPSHLPNTLRGITTSGSARRAKISPSEIITSFQCTIVTKPNGYLGRDIGAGGSLITQNGLDVIDELAVVADEAVGPKLEIDREFFADGADVEDGRPGRGTVRDEGAVLEVNQDPRD